MIENRPFLNLAAHLTLILGVCVVALPVWVAFVASTHSATAFMSGTIPMWPGDQSRSPGCACATGTWAPARYCSRDVRGRSTPASWKARSTRPEQSKPDGDAPPTTYWVPM